MIVFLYIDNMINKDKNNKDETTKYSNSIVLKGVSTHNLQHIDLSFPKNKIVTITGVSWSGKSSLAFHTIYKEWQFRYIESLSSYLRQFFNLGSRPDIEYSSWLSPAVAIEQNKQWWNSRSSVGTLTEIDVYLRLLYAKAGELYSYGSGKPIQTQNIETITASIHKKYNQQKVFLLHQLKKHENAKELATFTKKNRNKVEKEKWFIRYLIVSSHQKKSEPIEYFYLEEPNIPDDFFPINVYGIYDRITVEDSKKERLKEDIIKILAEENKFWIREEGASAIERFTDKNYDPEFDIAYPDFTSRHFSANRAEGACPRCSWLWEVLQTDIDKILDPESTYLRAILPRRDSNYWQSILKRLAQKYSIDTTRSWKDLPEWFLHVVLYGDNETLRIEYANKQNNINYKWIDEVLKEQYQKWMLTVDFQAMIDMKTCPECHGAKLRKESLHVFITLPEWSLSAWIMSRLDDHKFYSPLVDQYPDKKIKINIAQIQHLSLEEVLTIVSIYKKTTSKAAELIERILAPLVDRVQTIDNLGLWYLPLYRQIGTLSGWEIQRLRLTKQLWNKLTGIIYVLDEPTIGLHTKEIQKTIDAIKSLKEMGNTIIVVEHNEEFIKNSDRIIEIWPGAGDFWGKLVFNGPYEEFIKQNSLTADYITNKKVVDIDFDHSPSTHHISIKKAHKYNLKNIDVKIPLWWFTIITGASGAGKTTLMYTTLYKFLEDKQKFIQSYIRLHLLKKWLSRQEIIAAPVMKKDDYAHYENLALQEFYNEIAVDTIQGYDQIDNTLYVDQTSIWKTPRSCPATFVGIFNDIRTLYAGTNEAKYLWFNAGHFSFNSKRWACPECKWYGYKKIELQFLPDTYVSCELCHGTRYKPEITQIKRRNKSIADVLDMYIKDAFEFFKDIGHIAESLQMMIDIGLWYLKMWQPAQMLSGWESQRLKLIKHFLKSYKGHTVYFLDEPTVWLHPEDIKKLLTILKKFLERWDTILMIEHDKDLLKFADKVIELENWAIITNTTQPKSD